MENGNTEITEEIKTETPQESAAVKPQKKKNLFGKIKTKDIALAAVLTGLSILFPLYLPTIDIGITSVTPFSHLAIMLAMFINPIVAVLTCAGALGAFFIKGVNPTILVRAGSHIVFALAGSLIMYKRKGYKGVSFYTVCGIVTLLHAVFEMLSALVAIKVGAPGTISARNILIVLGLITAAHSIFDYSFAVLIYNTLSQARLVKNRFDLRIIKKKKVIAAPEIPAEIPNS